MTRGADRTRAPSSTTAATAALGRLKAAAAPGASPARTTPGPTTAPGTSSACRDPRGSPGSTRPTTVSSSSRRRSATGSSGWCSPPGPPSTSASTSGRSRTSWPAWGYESYGYLTEQEFPAPVNWKNGLEAFAESYHFPYVHGQSVIGQNTVANTSTHDAYGRHHRMGFPFNWITALNDDPSGDWDPSAHMGIIYWVFPNLVLANSPLGVELIDILPAGRPRELRRPPWLHGPGPSDRRRGPSRVRRGLRAGALRSSRRGLHRCSPAAVTGCATDNTTRW